jgi:hypothetical protein
MEPTLRQGCVVAVWSDEEETYVARVGKEDISGLNPIAQKLATNGWEIVSVVVLTNAGWSKPVKPEEIGRTKFLNDSLAIFIKKFVPAGS